MADAHKNFAYSLVATAPSPATTGTSLVVTAGQGALFPATPFNATIWPVGVQPLSTNAEVVRVTAVSTDTLTIVRVQESSSARTVIVGDQIAATVTAKTLTDVEAGFSPDMALSAMKAPRDNTIPAATSAYVVSDYECGGRYGPLNSVNGGSSNTGFVFANPVTLPAPLVLTALYVFAPDGVTFGVSGNLRAGVYADNSGAPGALLYSLTPKAFVAADTLIAFTGSAIEVAASVWLAFQFDVDSATFGQSASETGAYFRATGVTYAGGLPNPFGTPDVTGSALVAIYALAGTATEIGVGSVLEVG